MVPWLRPGLLVKAGLEVAVSDLFARFVDKREVEAGLPPEPIDPKRKIFRRVPRKVQPYTHHSYRDDEGSLWFDYASDVGEGFHPTYTVAWLLAQTSLTLGTSEQLPRGRFLVLGGDQAYPAASWEEYQNRFVGPYSAALPFVPEEHAPHLYAIPGNHDWYDGLTAFMRLFCQGGWIGGWRTRQKRSYFARQLSKRWWLWATDIQFDTYIDGPQLDYFGAIADGDDFGEQSRVILVTAKPSWTGAEPDENPELKKQGSWEALRFFEQHLIESTGAKVGVTISGDKHHYSRYTRQAPGNPRERITAGGGGAHTSATHSLPDPVDLRPDGAAEALLYTRERCVPSIPDSERMRTKGVLGLATEHRLGLVIGLIYGLIAILLAGGVKDQNRNLAGNLDGRSYGELLWDAGNIWVFLLIAILIRALVAFAKTSRSRRGPLAWIPKKIKGWLFGIIHGVAHSAAAWAATIGALILVYKVEPSLADSGLQLGWVAAGGVVVFGFVAARVIFGLYLMFANVDDPRQHVTEIFGGLASTDYKNFLRFKLDEDETLTIYPVGIPRSPEWELEPQGSDLAPWFKTKAGGPELEYGLIDDVIVIDTDGSR